MGPRNAAAGRGGGWSRVHRQDPAENTAGWRHPQRVVAPPVPIPARRSRRTAPVADCPLSRYHARLPASPPARSPGETAWWCCAHHVGRGHAAAAAAAPTPAPAPPAPTSADLSQAPRARTSHPYRPPPPPIRTRLPHLHPHQPSHTKPIPAQWIALRFAHNNKTPRPAHHFLPFSSPPQPDIPAHLARKEKKKKKTSRPVNLVRRTASAPAEILPRVRSSLVAPNPPPNYSLPGRRYALFSSSSCPTAHPPTASRLRRCPPRIPPANPIRPAPPASVPSKRGSSPEWLEQM